MRRRGGGQEAFGREKRSGGGPGLECFRNSALAEALTSSFLAFLPCRQNCKQNMLQTSQNQSCYQTQTIALSFELLPLLICADSFGHTRSLGRPSRREPSPKTEC